MYSTLDKMNSFTGWTAAGGAVNYNLNEYSDYIANDNTMSCIFKFAGGSVTKTYSQDVSQYSELILHLWSRNKQGIRYTSVSDYYYKVTLNNTDTYYLETRYSLVPNVIDISGYTTITSIKIEPTFIDEDYLIVSEIGLIKDEMPLDIFNSIKSYLEKDISSYLYKTIKIGEVTCGTGDTLIDLVGDYVYRYAVILIDDGVNSEIHHIHDYQNGRVNFSSIYDGTAVLHDYTNADVYLQFPVEFGRTQIEFIAPCIAIWGMVPEFVNRISKIDSIYDTIKNDSLKIRREGQIFKYNILIDCEAQQYELIALMQDVVKALIANEYLWVNGRKIDITFASTPTEIEPTEALEIIPKVQYNISIEIKEEIWARKTAVWAQQATLQVNL